MNTRQRRDFFADFASLMAVLYAIADLLAITASAFLASFTTFGEWSMGTEYRVATVLCLLLLITVFGWSGLYTSWRGRSYLDQAGSATLAWITALGILMLLDYLLHFGETVSREYLFWFAIFGGFTVVGTRLTVMLSLRALRHYGWNHKRLIIVGSGDWAAGIARRLRTAGWLGLDVVAIVDHDEAREDRSMAGIPVQSGYGRLRRLIEHHAADEVWICLPLSASDHIEQIREELSDSTVTQCMVPEVAEYRLMNHPMSVIVGLPVLNLSLSPMHGLNRIIKEIEDKLLASLILLLVSPLMIAIAIAIKATSPGPIIFKQRRHGWDGRPINVYKFRTMVVHQERGVVTQARRGDSRVTPVGRFLRATSLDELPQFFNVLQGRMSIVGPRPHAIEHNHYYMSQIDDYMRRHKVKPGISGWAQVNGLRGQTDTLDKMRKRVQYDLYYIDNWSVWFDLKIIVLTVLRGFVHPNAY
jgi:Undecaprenyl-phosphate glucose phosphotransferase